MNLCIFLTNSLAILCISGVDIGKLTYLVKYLLGCELSLQVRFCNSVVCEVCAHRGSDLLPTSCLRIMKQAIVRVCHTDYSHLLIVA